jgi:hypothetical protein
MSAPVSYQNAKDAAATWLANAALPEDLRGRVLNLATFETEEDCRFFYPRRALAWQHMLNTAIRKGVLWRKAKIKRVILTRELYEEWRGARPDTPELRREFADSHTRLEPAS